MNRAAVLGSPVAHSLSPALHTAGYRASGLTDWRYDRYQVTAEGLTAFLAGLDSSWRGLSLTMPLKSACLEVADSISEIARRAGVGNTLVRDGMGWAADNTDVGGLVDALTPAWQGWQEASVLGAGATARSALLALETLGVEQVSVHARRADQIAALQAWARQAAVEVRITAADLGDWEASGADVVISTLPGGALTPQPLPVGSGLVFDAVYADWPTPLAQAGAAAGRRVISGLDLLVGQAARQFSLFTGEPASVAAMLAAGQAALGHRVAPERSIVLIGFMGAGKTTTGRRLAKLLDLPFLDSDDLVEASAGPIPEIFARQGEQAFRQIEARVIADQLAAGPAVVALGGGAAMTPAVADLLADHEVVLLEVSLEQALARVGGDPNRPMLARPDLPQLYADRLPVYRTLATHAVGADARTPTQVARLILAGLTDR